MMSQFYKTYLFKNKDPIIDVLRTAMKGHDMLEIAAKSGVAETTIYAWLYGMTKRPQHATLKAVFNAIDYVWEPHEKRVR